MPAKPTERPSAAAAVGFAVLTVSDSRSVDNDRSGDVLAQRITAAGHLLVHRALVRDEADAIESVLRRWLDDPAVSAVVSTGGTGITGRDVTPEAFRRVLEKELPGFGELFRARSFAKIGAAAMLSRALGGVAQGRYLFALPGSPGAVADAWDGILAEQFDIGNPACSLLELAGRLQE